MTTAPQPALQTRGIAAVLAAVAIVMPPLAIMTPLGVAPLLSVASLALLAIAPRRSLAGIRRIWPLAALWAALAAWATLSSNWSILPRHSLFEGLRLVAIGVEGVIVLGAATTLSPQQGRRVGQAAALGVALAIALFALEGATGARLSRLLHNIPSGPLINFTRFDRGATTLVLAVWPALLVLRPRILGWSLGIAVATAVWFIPSQAAALAAATACATGALAWRLPRVTAAMLGLGLLAVTIVLPLAAPSEQAVLRLQQDTTLIKPSGFHRLLIWRFTADRIAERPLLGWGMDASRELPGGHNQLAATAPGVELPVGAEALPLHPHNAALQWEVELGVPGTVLCLAIVLWGLWRVGWRARLAPAQRAVALAWAGAALTIALLSYGVWQAWWLSTLWTTAALLVGSAADDG